MANASAQRRLKRQRQKAKEKLLKVEYKIRNEQKSQNQGEENDDIQIEYVYEPTIPQLEGHLLEEFSNVVARFTLPTTTNDDFESNKGVEVDGTEDEKPSESFDEDQNDQRENALNLSKKKLKRLNRMTLAQLKQYARRPEVVEWEDVTAKDPKLFVQLKSMRHTVPVPRHWIQKRKYLAGKRGYVKPPFELPTFIRDTGITEMRDAMRAQDAAKRIKVKAREKMHPKLGRISVDYERLYDAFFKYQTKPPLTMHGDLYYEGKEFEGKQDRKPGHLSEELRVSLGMTTHLVPPPWLQNMQKYGGPPSYPHIKIPGLNAPIPEGAQWGYHPGGWGKPPVDNFLRDLPNKTDNPNQLMLLNPIERNLWGELEPDEDLPTEYIEEAEINQDINEEDQLGDGDDVSNIPEPATSETIEVRRDRRRK